MEKHRVFLSYSHADSTWLERVKVHLRPLVRKGALDVWNDGRITPGTDWRAEITTALLCADAAVLLVSADFLASEFVANNELPPILRRAQNQGLLAVPIIVEPCLFREHLELACHQSLNPPERPLSAMTRHDAEQTLVCLARLLDGHFRNGSATRRAFAVPAVVSPHVPRSVLESLGPPTPRAAHRLEHAIASIREERILSSATPQESQPIVSTPLSQAKDANAALGHLSRRARVERLLLQFLRSRPNFQLTLSSVCEQSATMAEFSDIAKAPPSVLADAADKLVRAGQVALGTDETGNRLYTVLRTSSGACSPLFASETPGDPNSFSANLDCQLEERRIIEAETRAEPHIAVEMTHASSPPPIDEPACRPAPALSSEPVSLQWVRWMRTGARRR